MGVRRRDGTRLTPSTLDHKIAPAAALGLVHGAASSAVTPLRGAAAMPMLMAIRAGREFERLRDAGDAAAIIAVSSDANIATIRVLE
jgi:hypothetical protein